MNMMREAEILDKYSVEHLLLQLEKLRKIALADGQIIPNLPKSSGAYA
jgi:hypothetical protein